jgi:hypothetical protein
MMSLRPGVLPDELEEDGVILGARTPTAAWEQANVAAPV